MKIKVGIIFGGKSVEHEISIISALQAMDNINKDKYEVIPIYIAKDGKWYTSPSFNDIAVFKDLDNILKIGKQVILTKEKDEFILLDKNSFFKKKINTIDIVFPIVHGTNVEDGTLQGYLETIGVPYVGTNVYSSVVGQDKIYMKQIFASEGLSIPKYTWFYDHEFITDNKAILKKIKEIGYPVIIKPATLGSSVGIGFAHNDKEAQDAIEEAISYDGRIVVEEVIPNLKEVNISILGNNEHQEVSVIEEVTTDNNILTYDDKYKGGKNGSKGMVNAARKIPADIPSTLQKEVEELGVLAFKALNSRGVVRIDFLVDTKKAKAYINEINNIPGSLAFYLWEKTNKPYPVLIDELITMAIKDYKKNLEKVNSFDTNILSTTSYGVKGIKGKIK